MNASELDTAYTAMAEAIQAVGAQHEPVFLATLALGLMAKQTDLTAMLDDIAQAQRLALT
jgi:hypothetical protein